MRYKTLFFLLTFVWTALSVTGKQRICATIRHTCTDSLQQF